MIIQANYYKKHSHIFNKCNPQNSDSTRLQLLVYAADIYGAKTEKKPHIHMLLNINTETVAKRGHITLVISLYL